MTIYLYKLKRNYLSNLYSESPYNYSVYEEVIEETEMKVTEIVNQNIYFKAKMGNAYLMKLKEFPLFRVYEFYTFKKLDYSEINRLKNILAE